MKIWKLLFLSAVIILLSGCGSSNSLKGKSRGEIIAEYAKTYQGAPYKYGGTTPKGFDCSGFVNYVYGQFSFNLPRSSSELMKKGAKINEKKLKPGDLVFFKGSNKKNKKVGHVGIVTETHRSGKFKFIHVSTTKGVRTDDSELDYYKTRYLQARRIIQ